VLGYHHPLAIVKRYGTLDHVSGGRVILGVGVGTLKEEFDLLGAPFDDRGDRADDALRALRAGLSSNEPVYAGKYYSFGGLTVDLSPASRRKSTFSQGFGGTFASARGTSVCGRGPAGRLAWMYAVTHSGGPRGHCGSTQGRADRRGGPRSLRAHRPLR